MGDLEQKYKDFFNNEEKCLLPNLTMDMLIASYNNLGIDDGYRLTEPIRDIVSNLTFLELSKKTGKNLIITATHIESMQPTYFSVDNTPHVLVIEAVKASMAVPLFVRPIEIGNDYYMDGGITDGIPVNIFNNVSPEAILIFHLSNNSVKIKEISSPNKPSFIKFMSSIMQTYLRNYLGIRLLELQYPNYCQLTSFPISFLPFQWMNNNFKMHITEEQINESVSIGYRQCLKFLEVRNIINET
jgi:predicted acylesterase/phospholipase RssA